MLVKFETFNMCKSEEAIKRCLRLSLKEIQLGTIGAQYSVSKLLSEDEEATMEKLIADNKFICHYKLEDVIGQKNNNYIASTNFCKLPSGFVVGVADGKDVFPRFLGEVSSTNEKICFTSNPQPIGFRGNLLVKRQKFFYCTYSLGITETS